MTNVTEAESILSQIQAAGVSYAAKAPGAREALLNLSRNLISQLELPSEAIMRMGWAEPAMAAHCRIAIDLGIFGHLGDCGESGITAQELAVKCSADQALISRIMNHLAAMNVVSFVGDETYASAPLAKALAEVKYKDGILFLYDVAGVSFRYLPEYLKQTNYAHPHDTLNGPFQAAHKTNLPLYSWLDKNNYIDAVNNYLSTCWAGEPTWVDPNVYPVADRLINGFNSEHSDVFLVDIGGGLGQDLLELKQKHPNIPGRLILQERDVALSTVNAADVFDTLSHDFFTPQPIKHARAYYFHSVLHNWRDDDCVRILQQLRPAMKKGYSRLLLNEIVLPRRDHTWQATGLDQLILVCCGVQERTEAHIAMLLKRAGFRLTRVYTYELCHDSIIEAEVDDEE
ncbi:putative hydroxyindole O-methyltransferase [Xylaria nigripes]|nr:putative hydroxyindole O-methyltransferase [Xylaria nigripes]